MMVEDRSFNAFLKSKLEEGVEVPELRLDLDVPAASPQRIIHLGWWPTLKIAASLAVLCGVLVWRSAQLRDSRHERQVVQAIDLLEECRALTLGEAEYTREDASSMAEKLLAWQDAPFAEVASLQEQNEGVNSVTEGAGEGEAPNPSGA